MENLQHLIDSITRQVESKGIVNVLELKHLFKAYSGNDWKGISKPDKKTGNSILIQNDQLRLSLIFWDSFQKSKKHGHPQGGGLMKILTGNLTETRFDPDDPNLVIGTYRYGAGDIAYIHDRLAFHIVENDSIIPAVSLHVYSPGIYASGVLNDRGASGLLDAALKEAA